MMARTVVDCGECHGRGYLERTEPVWGIDRCPACHFGQIRVCACLNPIDWDAERCPKCLEPDGPAPSRAADEPADARG